MSFLSQFTPYSFPTLGLVRLPSIIISDAQKVAVGLKPTASNYDFLRALARKEFKMQVAYGAVPIDQQAVYIARAKYELEIFEELGFVDYVLLVWMVIEKAREVGAFIDYGRGSCAGSYIFALLKITGVDPIAKNLLFERFVSRIRSKKQVIDGHIYLQGDLIADADLNLGTARETIVEWLKTIYPNRVAKISTRSTLTGKILLKEVYKCVEEASEDEARHVANLVEKHFGIVEDIEESYKTGGEFKMWADEHKRTYQIALQLRDLIRNKSSHASGYLISFYDFDGFLPLEVTKEGELMSSFDMQDVSHFCVKLDLLGLTTNAIIKNITDNITEDITKINLDGDPLIYDQFQHGTLLRYGLYQISADCAYGVTNAIKPKNVFELSDVNAIARPSALAYLKGYTSGDTICPHPIFEKILKPTRNHCLYQEQMMQMAVAIGFTLDEAEILRKIVGKKQVEKVKEWQEKIKQKVKDNNLPENVSDIFWKILDESSRYSFNLSHSLATSYLTALTVYLKYKHPLQFYWACLKAAKDMPNTIQEITAIIKELPYFGIKILPPDIVKSGKDFTIEDGNIRFGLGNIKGISDGTMDKLVSLRREFKSKFDIFNAAQEAKIGIGILVGIIMSGSIDSNGISRAKLALEAQLYNILTPRETLIVRQLASQYQEDLVSMIKDLGQKTDEKGKPYIKESRLATLRRDFKPFEQMYRENSRNEELFSLLSERHFLGFSYTSTLHQVFGKKIEGLMTIDKVLQEPQNIKVRFVGFIDEVKKATSLKSRKPYIKFTISDETGAIKVMLHGDENVQSVVQFHGELPDVGDIVVISGSKGSGDMTFCGPASRRDESFVRQVSPFASKKSDLKVEI